MGEFIRKLLRWIIFIVLVVLLILVIIKLANKNGTAKKTKKVVDNGVEAIKKETKELKLTNKKKNTKKTTETTKTETTKEETKKEESVVTSTLEVEAPDTSSDSYLYIIGIVILGGGTYYIYKNRNLNN